MVTPDPLPAATVVKPPSKVSGVIVATLLLVAIGTLIGFVVAYVASFIVVKASLPAVKLVIALPLLAVGAFAWAITDRQTLRDGAITVLAAGALAAALFAAWRPASPAKLFTTKSELTDVQVQDGHASIELRSRKEMTAMPPFGATLGYTTLLACLAVIVSTIAHGAVAARKRSAKPF